MSPNVMLAFAGVSLQWGQPTFAWLLVVGFALFLRTGEIFQLAPHHVTLARKSAIVFVEGSKGSKQTFLALERLEIDEPTALLALRNLLKTGQGQKPFWGESRRSFMDNYLARNSCQIEIASRPV